MKNHRNTRSAVMAVVWAMLIASGARGLAWEEADFEARPRYSFSVEEGVDTIIGQETTYRIRKGDTLLDIARWYGLSAKEVSDGNRHMDWWTPPIDREILLPTSHILPDTRFAGLVLNIPEMRLYYFAHPSVNDAEKVDSVSTTQNIRVYSFPVGIGRIDWRTPVGSFKVTGKTHNPTWVVPEDIYREHLERDGEAERVIAGGDPENPLGHYRLSLSLRMYSIHGTDVPWGVGMMVSHGCIRLYPEDIDRLFHMVKVGTAGRFVYQPIKFGQRGGRVYAEVHDDLYGKSSSLWDLAMREVQRRSLRELVDLRKLVHAVESRTGMPVDVTIGADHSLATVTGNLAPRCRTVCR